MCGIAGALRTRPGAELETSATLRMADSLRHRGPDAEGSWSDGICSLAHRRLSIIDLSEAGRQPLCNEDGTIWTVFNGEIYNFQELRAELKRAGHQFRTGTDTEVLVHGYEQWGTNCVRRLRGMFAFAIYDQRNRKLFLARDRVGKKPLFYTWAGDRLLFASELQGLLACPEVSREPDLPAIDSYLSWGYIPAPLTGFRSIKKLPPAHWMTVDVRTDGHVTGEERYWSLTYSPKLGLSEPEAVEAIREKMTEAVRLRMISDVPLGAFLSGGIDSSIVVGLMAGLSSSPVKTFSIGFDEAVFNELDHARRIAERWRTDHHELIVRPDALAVLPTLVRHFGEPYADSSAVPTFYVSQMTRQHVTVALNGDGGDESFAGYERYLGNRIADTMGRVPGSRLAAGVVSRIVPDSKNPRSRLRSVRRFMAVASQPVSERYGRWMGYLSDGVKGALYTASMNRAIGVHRASEWLGELFHRTAGLDPVDAAMAVDIASYLPFDLLVKVDITSMANSLEARSPFLDHEVMELAARLPSSMKLRGKRSKWILTRAFEDLLPSENVNRRKMGFGVPVGQWFRGPMREFLRDNLLSGAARQRGYFVPGELQRLVEEHESERCDHTAALWNLLMLELWHRELVDTPVRAGVDSPSREPATVGS